jgi:hypothetical protein
MESFAMLFKNVIEQFNFNQPSRPNVKTFRVPRQFSLFSLWHTERRSSDGWFLNFL